MGWWKAIPLVSNVIDGLFGLFDEVIEDKDERNKLKAQMTEVLNQADLTRFSEQLKAQASIVLGEVKGESWLQRNWRPVLMLSIVGIVVNNYILYPYLSLFGAPTTMLELPDALWNLMQIGVGGYVVGRSGEKVVKQIWSKDK